MDGDPQGAHAIYLCGRRDRFLRDPTKCGIYLKAETVSEWRSTGNPRSVRNIYGRKKDGRGVKTLKNRK